MITSNGDNQEIEELIFNKDANLTALTSCMAMTKSSFNVESQDVVDIVGSRLFPSMVESIPEFPDWREINENPDFYIRTWCMNEYKLMFMVDYASFLYYNMGFEETLTDNAFDALQWHLRKILKGKYRPPVGAKIYQKTRIQLPHPMMSLDKVKPGEKRLIDFIEDEMIWSEKLDGVSFMIEYKNGRPVRAYTRGDGIIGGDMTHLIPRLDIPKKIPKRYGKKLFIRGELVISWKKFNSKEVSIYGYVNPRSFVVGFVNSLSEMTINPIEFRAYRVINKGYTFDDIEEMGFKTPAHGILESPKQIDLIMLYTNQRSGSKFKIDGIVLEIESSRMERAKRSNPELTVAFKMMTESQIRDATIVDVEWNVSRFGRYNPKAIYTPVFVDGSRLEKATLHNAKWVMDRGVGKGTKVKIVKSGDIIPVVKEVISNNYENLNGDMINVEPILPGDEFDWHWDEKEVFIYLDEIDTNHMVQMKRSEHFFTVFGIRGVGMGAVKNLYNIGIETLQDICNASASELMGAKGIGKVKSFSIYEGIRSGLGKATLDRLIYGSTVLEGGIGQILLKQISIAIPNIVSLAESGKLKKKIDKMTIKGFGKVRKEKMIVGMERLIEWMSTFNEEIQDVMKQSILDDVERRRHIVKDPYIEGNIFIMTGFMAKKDMEMKLIDIIYDNGGLIQSSFPKEDEVKAVIVGNISGVGTGASSKIKQAMEKQVPVFSVEEFMNMF